MRGEEGEEGEERDEGEEARLKMEAQVAEMKAIMTRQESTFQRTLENDRNKISGEIKSKMAKLRGLEVNILGKRMKTDAHTVLAAGGITAAFGNVDTED